MMLAQLKTAVLIKLDRRVKEKQPTSAQHMWEILQDLWKSIPHEAGWENAKSVQSCQGKG